MKKIKVGIIGAGFGERVVLPCVNFTKKMEVKYIFCRNLNRIKNKFNLKYATTNYKEIFEDKEIKFIFIETPPYTHKKFLQEAINYKKNVICEKPLSDNLRDAKKMNLKTKKSKIFSCVNHQLRFHPNVLKLKEIIKKNTLGKINYISIDHHTNMIDEKNTDNWWFSKKSGGGQILALGSHMVDLFYFLNGKITEVKSFKGNYLKFNKKNKKLWKNKIDTYFTLICKFKNGSTGNINCSCVASGDSGLNIVVNGEKGTVKLTDFTKLLLQDSFGKFKDIGIKDNLTSKKTVGVNPWRSSLVRYLLHISKNYKRKSSFKGATFDDALATQKILDQVKK